VLSRLIVALVLCSIEIAHAGRPGARVVLVDPDPELRRAVTTALAPWKLEVIVDPNPEIDGTTAAARADALSARFVVWREGNELVVFDRERGESLRREGQPGTLDPIAAASAALTVKTLMRLPPPGEQDKPAPARGAELRVQAGFETRVAHGSDTAIGGRLVGAVLVRPLGDLGLRIGVLGDTGTADSVSRAGFKGTWSDWAVLLLASWTVVRGRLEIEPYVAGGLGRSRFSGIDMMVQRDEHETLPQLRGGGWVRWRCGMWTVGGAFGVHALLATPTYTRPNNGMVLYESPSIAVSIGLVIAADLGR